MEKNYVVKLLKILCNDKTFLSKKQEKFFIGLSDNDIKKVKKYCIEESLIEQINKDFIVTKKGLELIKDYKNEFDYLNLEYLKLDKTPPILAKAIRALARHYLEKEELKKDSLEKNLKKELLNFKDLQEEIKDFIFEQKQTNLEELFNKFLDKGLTKSIISTILLTILSKNKNKLAFYEKNQFELNFTPLMFDRIIANPKNFEIKKAALNSTFLDKEINVLDKTKELILKFKTFEKITIQTNNLSDKTLKFKNIVLNAKDPMQLFDKDLERIFESEGEFNNTIKELENFYDKTIKGLKEFTFSVFKTKSLEELKTRFDKIKEFINNKELLILANNLNSIERLATYINQKRVPKDWNDLDIANFKLKTKELANLFLIIESTIEASNSTIEIHTQSLIDEILKLDKIQKNLLLRKVV